MNGVLLAALIGLILTASPTAHAQSVSPQRTEPQSPPKQTQQAAPKPTLRPIACKTGSVAPPIGPMEAGTCFKDCPDVCPEMIVIPAGSFMMGIPAEEDAKEHIIKYDEHEADPVHAVTIRQSFALSKFDITKFEYNAFVKATSRKPMTTCALSWDPTKLKRREFHSWADPGFSQTDQDPVVCISWDDAVAYARYLSDKTGKMYRLASETEWEYAARAGTTTSRWWGNSALDQCKYANGADRTAKNQIPGADGWETAADCFDGYPYTSPVGSFAPNRFGLYDMLGNVTQWTADCWLFGYVRAPKTEIPSTDGDCNLRVVRGGSWWEDPNYLRSGSRTRHAITARTNWIGIRIARTISP